MRIVSTGALAVSLAALVSQPAQSEAIFGLITSENSAITQSSKAWLEKVAETLPGGYEYSIVSGGALIGRGTEIPGFRDGIVDGGMVSMMYSEADLPVNNFIASLSLLATDSRAAGAAFAETVLLHCDECLTELVENNIMPIGPYATSPYSLFCRQPVQSLADLKGRTIRATGALGRLAQALGGVPVNIGVAEIFEGLQRGQLDCTVFTAGSATQYSFQDVAPYIVTISSGPVAGPTAMSLRYDLWESMDKATRQVFVDAAPEAAALGIYGYYLEDAEVLGNPEKYKITVTPPSADIQAVIDEMTEKSVTEAIEAAKSRGVENPEEIVATYREMLDKWNKVVAEVGLDQAAFAAALKREIFDHFPIDR